MNIKHVPLFACVAFASLQATAQDLTSMIPAQAQFVFTINNKAIVENSSIELLNETLIKLGAFENTSNDINYPIKNLMQLDFNLDKQAYVYRSTTDSLNYIGILIPLNENHQVKEHMFSKFESLPIYNNYERRVSKDHKMQVAWNKESLFILIGELNTSYFQTKEIAERYGLDLGLYNTLDWTYNETLDAAANTWDEEEIDIEEENSIPDSLTVATAEAEEEAVYVEAEDVFPDTLSSIDIDEWEYDSDTTDVEDYDLESDSLYLINQAREAKNDSIKNKLLADWLTAGFNDYLDPKENLGKNKALKLTDKKHLLRLWISNLDELYQNALPYDILKMAYGVDIENMKYGYNDAIFDLIQDQYTLKLTGSIDVDSEMEKVFKALYSNRTNKKFAQYIPENYLAYASVNMSTEGYLKQLPALISRWYAPLAGEYADVLTIAATALEIGLDEKAIGKVMRGDNVFFLNNLQKVTKEYVSYEYDDDYNYEEVTKTKEEFVPNFLWMFTSEDQRLYKKILEFAVKKQEVTLEDGRYKIAPQKKLEPIYILFKNNIVFVGSDVEQLTAIQQNRFKTNRNASVKKDLLAHPFNFVVKTSAIPEVVNQLEIPITESREQTLQDLAGYGNLQIKSSKLIKNRFSGEMSISLPKKDKNALQYLLKHIIENLNNNVIN
ncbi:hypothetical protein [Sphingobacterium faecium]|uniref:hypothetical protein n=1 Tax=Sphingobacterium faecium TaxID=34087 RepID=UPI0024689B8C|nr:hypothetical protein [Sphingobacterium faecium]MDH5826733.1 hypothetical protein [Sphingobacterium faecium]